MFTKYKEALRVSGGFNKTINLNHKNIIKIHEINTLENDRDLYIVSQFIFAGMTLDVKLD